MKKIDVEDFSKKALQEAMAAASEKTLVSFSDKREKIIKHMKTGRELTGYTLPWPKTFNHIRMRPGELSVFCGFSGHGKSTTANQILLWAARYGDQTNPNCEGATVGMCSFEMPMEDIFECMSYQTAGLNTGKPSEEWIDKLLHWSERKFVMVDTLGKIPAMRVLGSVVALIKSGCNIISVDSLMFCGGVTHDLEAEESFCQALCGIARAYQVHIMLIHHSRKGDESSPPTKDMVKGTGGITDMASTVYMFWADKYRMRLVRKRDEFGRDLTEKEQAYIDKKCSHILSVQKQRFGRFEDNLALWSHPSRQYLQSPNSQVMNFDF